MEAQICKLLMEYCNRKLKERYDAINTKVLDSGIRMRNIDLTRTEPWLTVTYTNAYHTTLKEVVLVLRKLYQYW